MSLDIKERFRVADVGLEETFFLLLSMDREDPRFLELYEELHEQIDAAILDEQLAE